MRKLRNKKYEQTYRETITRDIKGCSFGIGTLVQK